VGRVENVADYLQLGDAFVFPTNLDSSPNTLLEAMRMGLPVVSTNVGGVPEIARGNGILTPPGDAAALGRALVAMAESPERRAAWGQVSLELGRQYSVEARCQALETIYASLVRVP
jgi:glycosyltransferase involved in cell wall biosynthesis